MIGWREFKFVQMKSHNCFKGKMITKSRNTSTKFENLLQNCWANFNQTWSKASHALVQGNQVYPNKYHSILKEKIFFLSFSISLYQRYGIIYVNMRFIYVKMQHIYDDIQHNSGMSICEIIMLTCNSNHVACHHNNVACWHKWVVCEHYYVACWHTLSCRSMLQKNATIGLKLWSKIFV